MSVMETQDMDVSIMISKAPVKESVAMVIRNSEGEFLVVRRADDDESLPGVWGLPAASIGADESAAQALVRAGRQKLGVRLLPGDRIGDDDADRGTYRLHLTDYEATILEGEPGVPQPDSSVSQYSDVKYVSDASVLFEAAQLGSLCSRVFLRSLGVAWGGESNDQEAPASA
ncbi:8-oxo-dGTP diphosphatase [Catenulispora sp. GP43]|uniref:NUDIX hydrolase n=1 Tax=Catenulispora sp. GP43 TaxID=3156263 RepID=UPI003515D123